MQDNEKRFEEDIEHFLLSANGGYTKGNQTDYDLKKAINLKTLIEFIKNTQPKSWERQVSRDLENAEKKFYICLQENINNYGLIYVLRHGFKDRGILFKICYFKPETNLNDDVIKNYNNNTVEVIRQFRYTDNNRNTIDMVLSLNGIPLVGIELKNQLKGQTIDNAKRQWMYDRDHKEFIFGLNNRFLVYFAVDLYEAEMFTQLRGKDTFFLPYNQGSNGCGEVGGAGNPASKEGNYVTAYLWEKVLQKDVLLSLVQRYIHFEESEETIKVDGKRTKKKSKKLIFPRYHQLDVVSKLISDTKEKGSGNNYLIQHSAGSGKSNSIAWLSYQLANLHNKENINIFTSIIIVTDRRVLDNQLQQTVFGFDHTRGMVEVIDEKKNSQDLKNAINDGKKIIITTLQKFPVIYQELDDNKGKRFAVIIDEAHSSQTGDSAKKLKKALADTEEVLEEYAQLENVEEFENDIDEQIIKEITTHGQHKNLSFFAFTATPKQKTLEMFGEKQVDGSFVSYHTYSMKQAIEEGFILDVLKNYMTYKTCYKIAKKTEDNEEVPVTKAVKLVRRFQELHPHNLQQKTALMIEQFKHVTKNKIGGNAKAMIVTSSRLHAVRYYHEFKRYIEKNNYDDLDILIAFSGVVEDYDSTGEKVSYTEENMNRRKSDNSPIKENQLPEEFKHDFNCLIVAEKYQTGFDEPLLHTMFIDKKLEGVKAVQTLSRLNRTCKGKNDTFILDFVNTEEDIKKSFSTFYENTILDEEVNVNKIYETQKYLRDFNIYNDNDIEVFAKQYYKKTKQNEKDLGKMTSLLKPVADRYNDLPEDKRNEFRVALNSFNKWYSYIIQLLRMFDKELQKEHTFTSYLSKLLMGNPTQPLDLEGKLSLEFYKLEKTFEGDISLSPTPEDKTITAPFTFTAQPMRSEKEELLDNIIQKINERFNGEFTDSDKVVVENIVTNILKGNSKLQKYAKDNSADMFEKSLFPEIFKKIAQDCYMSATDSYSKLFEDKNYYNLIMEEVAKEIYKTFRK